MKKFTCHTMESKVIDAIKKSGIPHAASVANPLTNIWAEEWVPEVVRSYQLMPDMQGVPLEFVLKSWHDGIK